MGAKVSEGIWKRCEPEAPVLKLRFLSLPWKGSNNLAQGSALGGWTAKELFALKGQNKSAQVRPLGGWMAKGCLALSGRGHVRGPVNPGRCPRSTP